MAEVWTPPDLDEITTDDLVTAAYLNQLGNSIRFMEEVAYVAFTSDVSVTSTTVGGANQVVSAGAITYEAVPHWIEFYCPNYTAPAVQTFIILRDSTTVLGTIGRVPASTGLPLTCKARVTPTAAAHTYNIAAWVQSSGTGTMNAGSGGTAGDAGTDLAGFIAVTRIPT